MPCIVDCWELVQECLVSLITNNARCTCETESRLTMAEQHSTKATAAATTTVKTTTRLFTSRLDLHLRKKQVKWYVYSITLYGAETWTLRKADQKDLENFEIWCYRRTVKINWTDRVRNEEVLHRVKEWRSIIYTIIRRKTDWIGHHLRRNCLLRHTIEEKNRRRVRSEGKTRKKTEAAAGWP